MAWARRSAGCGAEEGDGEERIRRRDIGIHSNAGRLRKVPIHPFRGMGFERREWLHMKNQAGWGGCAPGKLAGRVGGSRSGGRSRLWIRGRGNGAGAGGAGRAACWDGQRRTASGTVRAQHRIITAGGFVKTGRCVPGYCEGGGADELASPRPARR